MHPFTPVSSRHPAHLGSTNAIANFLLNAWRRYRHQRRLQMTMRLLHKLDDRCLKDIGLTRSEIESAVRHLPDRSAHRRIDLYGITPRG